MKKMSKVFGAVALSAALAMGTALPAFAIEDGELLGGPVADDGSYPLAADATYTDQEYKPADGTDSASGKTLVGVFSKVGQMKVSVPTHMALAINASGGAFNAPAARTGASTITTTPVDGTTTDDNLFYRKGTGYGIENLGGMPVKVSGVQGETLSASGVNFSLTNAAQTATSTVPAGTNLVMQVALVPGTPTKNNASATGVTAATAPAASSTTGLVNVGTTSVEPTAALWTIEGALVTGTGASSVVNAKVLPILVKGTTSKLSGTQIGETAQLSTDALNITYTIAMA